MSFFLKLAQKFYFGTSHNYKMLVSYLKVVPFLKMQVAWLVLRHPQKSAVIFSFCYQYC